MIEHDLLHWSWGDRDRRAGLRVIPPVQLPSVAEVLGMHLLRPLLHCTALPVALPPYFRQDPPDLLVADLYFCVLLERVNPHGGTLCTNNKDTY